MQAKAVTQQAHRFEMIPVRPLIFASAVHPIFAAIEPIAAHLLRVVFGLVLEYQPDRPSPLDLPGVSLRCAHRLHPLKKWSLRESRGDSERVHRELGKVMSMQDIIDRRAADGSRPRIEQPSEFSAFLRDEIAKWHRVVKASDIKRN